jgi:hypothetical protein
MSTGNQAVAFAGAAEQRGAEPGHRVAKNEGGLWMSAMAALSAENRRND